MIEEKSRESLEKMLLDDNSNKFIMVLKASRKYRSLKRSEKNRGKTEEQLFRETITSLYKEKKPDKEENEK